MINKKIIVISSTITVIIVFLSLIFSVVSTRKTIDSWDKTSLVSEKELYDESIQASHIPAESWLQSFLKNHSDDTTLIAHEKSKELNFFVKNCPYINETRTSENLILMGDIKKSQNSTIVLVAGVFQSGFSQQEFLSYLKKMDDCSIHYNETNIGHVHVISYDGGSFMVAGDVIVSVVGDNDFISLIAHDLEKTLYDYHCVNLEVQDKDYTRNVYRKTYQEWTKNIIVKTNIISNNIKSIDGIPHILSEPKKVEKPEDPLPEGFPSGIPSRPSRPLSTSFSNAFKETTQVVVPSVDTYGPGCGWEWTGLVPPRFNEKDINLRAEKIISTAQKDLDESNIQAKIHTTLNNVQILKKTFDIVVWNRYIKDLTNVYTQWLWLSSEREKIRPLYDDYIQSLHQYNTLIEEYNNNLQSYKKNIDNCFKEEYKKKNNSSRDDLIKICTLNTQPPDSSLLIKPEKFSLPDNVTIPDSWEKEPQLVEKESLNINDIYTQFMDNIDSSPSSNKNKGNI